MSHARRAITAAPETGAPAAPQPSLSRIRIVARVPHHVHGESDLLERQRRRLAPVRKLSLAPPIARHRDAEIRVANHGRDIRPARDLDRHIADEATAQQRLVDSGSARCTGRKLDMREL
jgi:hypothetical protein